MPSHHKDHDNHFATMNFILIVLTLALSAFAQRIDISLPTSGQSLSLGRNFTVRVEKGRTLTGSTEVGIGITLAHCSQNTCEDTNERLGAILYAGPFSPQNGAGDFVPFQNFTVQVPPSFQTGKAVLSVAHASLVGAGPFFFSEIANVTVRLK
ncbi:hypothetical protein BD410DRAFT_793581 [Rickenella mellea]|uniref:Uncharacterized protein n=1 Tax=Rickenella mellea TaxID=50990 RepID=A0A4Y7PU42_9AGAM|nr:hypothetical protein BD410DRAFT_793581 [Rickenella mellea]